jgi:hypothetical protein
MEQKNEQKPAGASSGATKRFSEMTGGEKVVHIGKVIVFLLSFGFAFPNIFSD